jgi:hypothetical protein
MSILCALGRHNWTDVVRVHEKPVRRELQVLIVPSLFVGPPYLAPTGIFFNEKYKVVGRVCRRCGKRREA